MYLKYSMYLNSAQLWLAVIGGKRIALLLQATVD